MTDLRAAERFKCPKCRKRFSCGTPVRHYGKGPKDWSCVPCAEALKTKAEPEVKVDPAPSHAIPEEW